MASLDRAGVAVIADCQGTSATRIRCNGFNTSFLLAPTPFAVTRWGRLAVYGERDFVAEFEEEALAGPSGVREWIISPLFIGFILMDRPIVEGNQVAVPIRILQFDDPLSGLALRVSIDSETRLLDELGVGNPGAYMAEFNTAQINRTGIFRLTIEGPEIVGYVDFEL